MKLSELKHALKVLKANGWEKDAHLKNAFKKTWHKGIMGCTQLILFPSIFHMYLTIEEAIEHYENRAKMILGEN